MNPKLKTLAYITFLSLLFSCSAKEKRSKTDENIAERTFPVRVQKIEKQAIVKTLDYFANLVPFKEIHYVPATPGRISKINVEVGSRVSKGQVLVEMDKTQLSQAKTQLENARFNFEKIDTLYKLGSSSEQIYEQTKAQYEVAKSNVQFLTENTTLISPVNGIVTAKYFENGEFYSGAPNTAEGKAAVITIMQINPLKAIVNISQTYFPNLKEGMKARISTDIYPEKVFSGTVFRIYPTIDPSTRTFKAEFIIPNPDEILRPGMYANIELALHDAETLVIPAIAVLKQEGTNNRYVFVNENGIARQINVTIDKRRDDKIEVSTNGLKEGSELIVEGQANLMNGSKINVIKD